jgi:hypothetical protein
VVNYLIKYDVFFGLKEAGLLSDVIYNCSNIFITSALRLLETGICVLSSMSKVSSVLINSLINFVLIK